jgi:ATP-dependent Clp protease ATP-binding subunit ClpA
MIAQELEVSLHMAFVEARQKRHEFITVEHLLLALIDNPSAAEALRSCGAKPDALRKDLTNFINEHTPTVSGEDDIDTQPTLAFQRVIQRAILHVQSSGKKEVNGANVLVAIYGEKDSHAVYFLQKQGVTRLGCGQFHFSRHQQGAAAKSPVEGETETEAKRNRPDR